MHGEWPNPKCPRSSYRAAPRLEHTWTFGGVEHAWTHMLELFAACFPPHAEPAVKHAVSRLWSWTMWGWHWSWVQLSSPSPRPGLGSFLLWSLKSPARCVIKETSQAWKIPSAPRLEQSEVHSKEVELVLLQTKEGGMKRERQRVTETERERKMGREKEGGKERGRDGGRWRERRRQEERETETGSRREAGRGGPGGYCHWCQGPAVAPQSLGRHVLALDSRSQFPQLQLWVTDAHIIKF